MGTKRIVLDLDENLYYDMSRHASKDHRSARGFLHLLVENAIKNLEIVPNKTDSNDDF